MALRRGAGLDAALAARIKRDFAAHGSSAHVPDVIAEVAELPTTHSGKLSEAAARNAVNRRPTRNAEALRNPACLEAIRTHPSLHGPAPSPGDSGGQVLEGALQRSWAALLGFSPVGLDDDFFDLGGHSLLAARMLAEIRRTTARDLPLTTLLFAPTIRRLAEIVRAGGPSSSCTAMPGACCSSARSCRRSPGASGRSTASSRVA